MKVIVEAEAEASPLGSDKDEAYDIQRLNIICTAPIIYWWKLNVTNATGVSLQGNDTQADVGLWYNLTVMIIDYSGWQDIRYVNITAWYDEGDDEKYWNYEIHNSTNPSRNANFKIVMHQVAPGVEIAKMVYPEQDGIEQEITFGTEENGHPFHNRTVSPDEMPRTANGTVVEGPWCARVLYFYWKFGNQTHWAPGDGHWDGNARNFSDPWVRGISLNDRYSWNFNITVEDRSNEVMPGAPINYDYEEGEFGIYKYTLVKLSKREITSKQPHGVWKRTEEFSVLDVANGPYNLNVTLETDLLVWGVGPEHIDASYVMLNNTYWLQGLYDKPCYNCTFLPGGSTAQLRKVEDGAPGNGTYQIIYNCAYWVYIPYGTPGGLYATNVIFVADIIP
jgi:hypothetical protein